MKNEKLKSSSQLTEELQSFRSKWKGGFGATRPAMAGDPKYGQVFDACIKPYVHTETTILEIGCGRGVWTRQMEALHPKKIYCFDALSEKHNNFWEPLYSHRLNPQNIEYFHVKDFLCNELEDNTIDYLFSYNVFVHISYSGVSAYLKNLYNKLKSGANCFVQILEMPYDFEFPVTSDRFYFLTEPSLKKTLKVSGFPRNVHGLAAYLKDYDGPAAPPGRHYLYGVKRFCEVLEKNNYEIISFDLLNSLENSSFPAAPVIHFKKGD